MFWSEIGSEPQIEQAGMDGSERKVVVSSGLSWPVSLTVDTLADRIYWTDEKLKCLGSATLEGENIRVCFEKGNVHFLCSCDNLLGSVKQTTLRSHWYLHQVNH